MKRNDIVYSKIDADRGPYFYGRITRIFPGGMVETIDCGKYVRIQPMETLMVINDYKGYIDHYTGRFVRMTTLRRLKQLAARYDKTVWKKNRKTPYAEYTQFIEASK